MDAKPTKTKKGERSRAQILEAALALFAERGWDKTTMRAIAERAGVSVGNAYYYFASKEHLIQGFYLQSHHEHLAVCEPALEGLTRFGDRLRTSLVTKIDTTASYHEFAAQLFKTAADPKSPLNPFSPESAPTRNEAIALMGKVVDGSNLKLPADLAIGIFAGSLTSTPALAAATEALKDSGAGISIGYGIAYPFGVIGVVLFVQLLPRLLKHDLEAIATKSKTENGSESSVVEVLVEVTNRQLNGKRIADSNINAYNACQISRIYKEGQLVPLHYDNTFQEGQLLLLIGRSKEIGIVIDYLGHRSDQQVSKDTENERQNLLMTNRKLSGKPISDIAPLKNYGVVITRITRSGIMFVPNANTLIQTHDIFTTVGPPENLKDFSGAIGHRDNAIDSTDLLSLSAGLTLGIIAGLIPLGLPGGMPVTLGLAGGPLVVGLLLGHFGKVGRIVGHIPRPTRSLLQDLGLVFFLADAGIKGGKSLWETVQTYGLTLFGLGILVSSVPMFMAWPLARKYFKLDPLQALGGICGSMTSTPALGAITAKTDSQIPVISYVSAYPVALIVMILVAKILIGLMI